MSDQQFARFIARSNRRIEIRRVGCEPSFARWQRSFRFGNQSNRGGRYDPQTDAWVPLSIEGAPEHDNEHSVVWTGSEMIDWGGEGGGEELDTGGGYCACSGIPVTEWYPDADGDDFCVTTDCNDTNPNCTLDCTDDDDDTYCVGIDCDDAYAACNVDCSDPDADLVPDCRDNCPGIYNPSQTDADTDGWGGAVGCDCDDEDPLTYPDAPEIHDGLNNQCPGYVGYGLIDEITDPCRFDNPSNADELSCPPQPGATAYRFARSTDPTSTADCLVVDTSTPLWVDNDPVELGVCHHYLVRSSHPFDGSWGANSAGVERDEVCP